MEVDIKWKSILKLKTYCQWALLLKTAPQDGVSAR